MELLMLLMSQTAPKEVAHVVRRTDGLSYNSTGCDQLGKPQDLCLGISAAKGISPVFLIVLKHHPLQYPYAGACSAATTQPMGKL